mmetsp:Transcript_9354/g.24746  ORF Transcript_9354/g.24746 Transcript_9354/m.24746 type:complete len:294 (-) Transcript_9354:1614-2495(-)
MLRLRTARGTRTPHSATTPLRLSRHSLHAGNAIHVLLTWWLPRAVLPLVTLLLLLRRRCSHLRRVHPHRLHLRRTKLTYAHSTGAGLHWVATRTHHGHWRHRSVTPDSSHVLRVHIRGRRSARPSARCSRRRCGSCCGSRRTSRLKLRWHVLREEHRCSGLRVHGCATGHHTGDPGHSHASLSLKLRTANIFALRESNVDWLLADDTPVEFGNSLCSLFWLRETHETKPARAALLVHHNFARCDCTMWTKCLSKLIFVNVVAQIFHKQVNSLEFLDAFHLHLLIFRAKLGLAL